MFLNFKLYVRFIDIFKLFNFIGYLIGIFIKVVGWSYRIKLINWRLVVKIEKGRYVRKFILLVDKFRVNKINKYGIFVIILIIGFIL